MIANISIIVAGLFLIVLSILDIKTFRTKNGFIPSILTTSFILIEFLLVGFNSINGAVFGLILGLFFIDLEFFEGEPDLKVLIALCMLLPNLLSMLYFALILSTVGFIYKLTVKVLITKGKKNEINHTNVCLSFNVCDIRMYS